MRPTLTVTKVAFRSPAYRAGIRKGDNILAFDSHPFKDALDFAFYDGQECFSVTFLRKGKEYTVTVRKECEQPMGIEYADLEMPLMHCANKCVFCFVDQCPKGMRPTLYVKDDDYRSSFACGSYVTLSNLQEEDIARIIRLGLSPLYISVHAFDPEVKKALCANPRSAKLFTYLEQFAAHGIALHTQIVMVEGMNDGEILKQTLEELYRLAPQVRSVAIVPVGLTAHREGLRALKPVSKESATATIDLVEAFSARAKEEYGTRWAWCSDEFYVLANRAIPEVETYEDFPQIENGVGMIATFTQEVEETLAEDPALSGAYTLVTGHSFAPTLKEICRKLERKYPLELDVAVIDNDWFGHTITVAGLLTGRDIVAQLLKRGYHQNVVLPHTTLKEFETVLLDGMSVQDIEEALQCKIHISRSGKSFIGILSGRKEENYE
ncbi:MAG: DUF512 domain-containing protein [Clostridia bacterium]|nr:DUF512 domain-containing protein [Clostridia bacterium]